MYAVLLLEPPVNWVDCPIITLKHEPEIQELKSLKGKILAKSGSRIKKVEFTEIFDNAVALTKKWGDYSFSPIETIAELRQWLLETSEQTT